MSIPPPTWTPTISAGAAAGTGASTALTEGADHWGIFTVTTGTDAAAGELAAITFGVPLPMSPTVSVKQTGGAWLDATATATETGLTVVSARAPAESTSYVFEFLVNAPPDVYPFSRSGWPFFTAAELAYKLQIDPDAVNPGTAGLLARLASDAVRDDLRLMVDFVAADTITLYGNYSTDLILPERPVINVTSVTVAGQTLQPVSSLNNQDGTYVSSSEDMLFDWRPDGRLMRVAYPGSIYANQLNWRWPYGVPVQITYSHGWQIIPSAMKRVALELASSAYVNPEMHDSERVGWVEWTTRHATMSPSDDQCRALDFYRHVSLTL